MNDKKEIEVLVIIQARMASSRLPGKTMIELDGRPLIYRAIERAQKAKNVDKVIVATSTNKSDDPLENFCHQIDVFCYRGSENDVLARFIGAAEKFNPRIIVRICGDEPLLDPIIIEKTIEQHIQAKASYTTTVGAVPKGLDVEVFGFDILKQINEEILTEEQKEHVTKFILDNSDKFQILRADFGKEFARQDIVLTVDTRDDFDFIEKIYFAIKNKGQELIAENIIALIDSETVKRKPIILVRTDGSKEKGLGDIITCMNILGKLKKDYEIIFVSKDYKEGINFIKSRGYEVLTLTINNKREDEIEKIKEFCLLRNIKYCIVELVPNDADYVKELSKFLKVMMIDFEGDIDIYSDILLCWDVLAEELNYKKIKERTPKLLGLKYIPFEEQISIYQKNKQNNELKNITITFGGSDPHNLTFLLPDALSEFDDMYNFTFILGPGFKQFDLFKEKIKNIKCNVVISPENIYEIFFKSDLVISGGGFTCFELACIGVPFIGISKISWEIQRLKNLESLGVGCFIEADKKLKENLLTRLKDLSHIDVRNKMAENSVRLIDGKGVLRIVDEIKSRWKDE